ncbi:MAG: TonB-dependent receptor [Sphingomonas sp.]|jgi:iron complex outermembrane receptor protein|uniref:TonB-dependent receptor plug domain-containing protein n=1 Tax=Sphingomonas sp. TaxID=28214 RepID=UPI0035628ACA
MHRHTISVLALAVASLAATPAFASDPSPETPAPAVSADQDPGDIIVTGTRRLGTTAAESATPIKLLGAETLEHVGQPNLSQALAQLVPSFTAEAFGGDTGNLTLSARLRGLSPNHVLVLINGKRRHATANLHVLGGAYQGGASPDLDLIPSAAIDHIEVLEQGAAAQYGSDAIAGVINIILKSGDHGGSLSGTVGQYYQGDGKTASGSLNVGVKVGEAGFLNLTGFYRFHDFSQQGGLDRRVTDVDGNLLPSVPAIRGNSANFPYVNKIIGDARSRLGTISYNAGYDFGDVQIYSFGTYGRRTASAYENFRTPDRVIASPVLGVAGTVTTPGESIFYPNGFNPREGLVEDDYAITGGIKGELSGWHWDLSSTFGEDRNKIYTYDSANASLFVDTHFTPTDFYDGSFTNKELSANLDISNEFEVGMAAPLNVAFGAEYRKGTYIIGSGDVGSTYKEGGQSFPGFQLTDAGLHSRENYSLYLDVAATPVAGLKLDAAARYEHYTDFGNKLIWKVNGRYDINPAVALRATISTGFRAPTLAEEYYSATNVSPTSAVVQLPANSAAAAIVGFTPLKPETSTSYSAGVVLTPARRLTITLDAYQVTVKNRIIGSGSIGGATALAAILAHGNVLDPTISASNVFVAAFTNALDTRTRGVDLTVSYPTELSFGKVDWTLSGTYNETKITNLFIAPSLINLNATSTIEDGSPKLKVIAGAALSAGPLHATLRETLYTGTSALSRASSAYPYVNNSIGTSFITDLEVGYDIFESTNLAVGANNLFNKRPPAILNEPGTTLPSTGANVYNSPNTLSPYGINGGYYYARITFKF